MLCDVKCHFKLTVIVVKTLSGIQKCIEAPYKRQIEQNLKRFPEYLKLKLFRG